MELKYICIDIRQKRIIYSFYIISLHISFGELQSSGIKIMSLY